MKKITLFLVAMLFSALSFAAVPRVMAYGLKSEMDTPAAGFTKFTFSTNTKPTKAYLIFYHAGVEVYRKDITTQAQKQLTNATYTIRTSDLPELTNLKWAIEVQGDAIGSLECTNDVSGTTTKYKFYRPQGVAIDNNPESDFFGRMYIALPRGGYDHTKGIVVFDPIHNVLSNSGITATGVTLSDDDRTGMHRIAINPTNNHVYYARSKDPTAIYELTPDATNILSDGGTAKDAISGLGFTRADAMCFDEDGTMYVMDNGNTATGGTIYKVKDGVKTKMIQNGIWGVTDIGLAPDGRGGVWIAQNRGNVTADNLSALSHINANGEADYVINKNASTELQALCPNVNGNAGFRGQCAYNEKEDLLAFAGNYMVTLFKVTYDANNKPTLTRWKETGKLGQNIDGVAFDHAGNLVILSATSEFFYHYAVPTNNNSCITPAKASMQVHGPASSRVLPHDLNVVDNGDSYTFTYKTNAYAQSGNLVLYQEDGTTIDKTFALPTPIRKNETCSIIVPKSDLPKRLDISWGIELTGKKIPKYTYLQEVTDQTREIYDFYNMMDVLVDNDPESADFGKIYIQMAYNGASDAATDRSAVQTAGLFIYDAALNELNKPSNTSIKITLPEGYTIGDDRNKFHRLAIDPKTGNLTYCYNVANEPAVFAIDRADMSKEVVNLVAGIEGLKRTAAHCYDAEGALYVMDLPGAGTIYKIKDGVATVFAATDSKWVNVSMTLESDGRGGLWVSQNRGQIDTYYQLAHINKDGVIDWAVYSGSENGFAGSSTRGALAYDVERNILAQGRNGKVELYTVSYEPTITLTPLHTIASNDLGTNIDGLAFDYAGDLYVVNSSKEKFQKFAVPTDNNTCLVPAKKALTVDGEVGNVRVFAYDLVSEQVGDQYSLSFKSNVPYQSGNIVFMDETGAQVGSKVVITSNPMLINRADLPAEVVNWGVELSAEKSTACVEYTDASSSDYTFYLPQGVAIDNATESDFFGRVYVANPVTASGYCSAGISVYDQQLNKLGDGYKATGQTYTNTTTSNRTYIHRIAVHPQTGDVYYAQSEKGNTAVYELCPDATNILSDGGVAKNMVAGISEITNANSLCFDDDGILYVLNDAGYVSGKATGVIYSIQDNAATLFTKEDAHNYRWAGNDNAVAPDGIGGFWVALYRYNFDDVFNVLSHVNKNGVVDYYIRKGNNDILPTTGTSDDLNASHRGHLAYYQKENLLAFGGANRVSLFSVEYDENGKPTLSKIDEVVPANPKNYSDVNIDGIAFDYAGNLFVVSATLERLYAFTVPTKDNTCLVPAKKIMKLYKEDPSVDVADNVVNSTVLAPYENQTVNATVTRTFAPNKYHTLTLPFDMNATQISAAFGDAKVYEFNDVTTYNNEEILLRFMPITNIEAGRPYILATGASGFDAEDGFIVEGVEIQLGLTPVTNDVITMQPVLDAGGMLDQADQYYLSKNALYSAGSYPQPIVGLRAYFISTSPLPIRARVVFDDNSATSIDMVEAPAGAQVRKIMKDGKLIIIRGEQQYNAQGQRIE